LIAGWLLRRWRTLARRIEEAIPDALSSVKLEYVAGGFRTAATNHGAIFIKTAVRLRMQHPA
jgi:hypothetical protein